MFANRLKRSLRRLFTSKNHRPQDRLTAAVIETLEQRQLLAIAWIHEPHMQLGNAPLVGSTNYNGTDQIALIWQTTGDVSETYTVDWAPQGTTNWSTSGVSGVTNTNTGVVDEKKPGSLTRINHSANITGLTFNTAYT